LYNNQTNAEKRQTNLKTIKSSALGPVYQAKLHDDPIESRVMSTKTLEIKLLKRRSIVAHTQYARKGINKSMERRNSINGRRGSLVGAARRISVFLNSTLLGGGGEPAGNNAQEKAVSAAVASMGMQIGLGRRRSSAAR